MSPGARAQGGLVLYDTDCALCSRSVHFIYRHDPEGRFRFAGLQTAAGRRLLAQHGLPALRAETVVLLADDGRAWTHSSAAVRIARGLAWPARALAALWLVPRPLRDWGYRLVARHRRRLFGGPERCPAPTPELRARTLE